LVDHVFPALAGRRHEQHLHGARWHVCGSRERAGERERDETMKIDDRGKQEGVAKGTLVESGENQKATASLALGSS
jgi:hypothetical protein